MSATVKSSRFLASMNVYGFLTNASNYFATHTLSDGSFICPKHHIEHTGKNVYTIVTDLVLYEHTGGEEQFERAKRRALRTVERLGQQEGGSWIFYPGNHDGRNMSNTVIDCGACVDALATLYADYKDKLTAEEGEKIQNAIEKCADTYLVKAVIDKTLTNQRLWGVTGLAAAYRALGKAEWKEKVLQSIERSMGDMWSDGTFPYYPDEQKGKVPEGSIDTTPFYHSRHAGFILYALEQVDESPLRFKDQLVQSAKLLVSMYGIDAKKPRGLEAKRWYFPANYEVASHSFDLYTLMCADKLSGDSRFQAAAHHALRVLMEHQREGGSIVDHFGGPHNFQCETFWTAHTAWAARAAHWLRGLAATPIPQEWEYYKDADILSVRTEKYHVLLRGKKKPSDMLWGASVGGGVVRYTHIDGTSSDPIREWEGSGQRFRLPPLRAWRDYKTLCYYVWVEIRAHDLRTALWRLRDVLRKKVLGPPALISHNTNVSLHHNPENMAVRLTVDRITHEYQFEENSFTRT